MAIKSVPIEEDAFKRNIGEALNMLATDAESIGHIAGEVAGAEPPDEEPEALRRTAARARSHAFEILRSAAQLAATAERLDTIADLRLGAAPGQ